MRSFLGPLIVLAVVLSGISATASPFGVPVSGQHIYDRTGLLTPAEVSNLEQRAAQVVQAGAPVVVYLQTRAATQSETQLDAFRLMNAWAVESVPGARDGLVMVLNLRPGDLRHGQVALFAGRTLAEQKGLQKSALDALYRQSMRPDLVAGHTAAGIAAGLDALTHDLVNGSVSAVGAPNSAVTAAPSTPKVDGALVLFLLNLLPLLYALVLVLLFKRAGRTPPQADVAPELACPTTTPPDDLPPALVGALLSEFVRRPLITATILDLARRGALALEPASPTSIQLRLLNRDLLRMEYERTLWRWLLRLRGSGDVIAPHALAGSASAGGWMYCGVIEDLHDALVIREWYNLDRDRRGHTLAWAGTGALILAAVSLIGGGAGAGGWAVLAAVLFLVDAALASYLRGQLRDPRLSAEGARVAARWWGYLAGLRHAAEHHDEPLDLDVALPYAIALDPTGKLLDDRLRVAQKGEHYSPAWFSHPSFYGYWQLVILQMFVYAGSSSADSGDRSFGVMGSYGDSGGSNDGGGAGDGGSGGGGDF